MCLYERGRAFLDVYTHICIYSTLSLYARTSTAQSQVDSTPLHVGGHTHKYSPCVLDRRQWTHQDHISICFRSRSDSIPAQYLTVFPLQYILDFHVYLTAGNGHTRTTTLRADGRVFAKA